MPGSNHINIRQQIETKLCTQYIETVMYKEMFSEPEKWAQPLEILS